MKRLKFIITLCLATLFIGCEDDERALDFMSNAPAPTNTAIAFTVTQDNTGLVTLTPTADGATKFEIDFGDGSEASGMFEPGDTRDHVYEEGTYEVGLTSVGINGLETLSTHNLVVSFQAPQNVEITIENDGTVSNTVKVNVTADFATMYEVDFGNGNNDVFTANIGEEVVFQYTSSGIFTINITVMSAAIETFNYTEEFEVTEVSQPVTAAPTPTQSEANVIAIYSDAYTAITTTEFPTDWSSSGFEEIEIEANKVIKYSDLAFTGIVTDYGNPTDLTEMEFVHFDYWTTDATTLGFKIVNTAAVPAQEDIENVGDVTQGEWVSIDIPLADFDMDRSQVTQLLFDTIGNTATVYIDNLYFWKAQTTFPNVSDDFEGNGTITTWAGDSAGMDNAFANPYMNSDNASATVLEYNDTGGQFANIRFDVTPNFNFAEKKSFSLKVYVASADVTGTQPNQISLKLQDGTVGQPWVLQTEIVKPIVLDAWQTVVFDFENDVTAGAPNPLDRADFNRVVLQLNGENNNDTVKGYIDDFQWGNDLFVGPVPTDDFEGNGNISTWFGDSCGMDNNFVNPFNDAANSSATVLEYNDTGGQFANIRFDTDTNFNMEKRKFSVKVYVASSDITGAQPNQISLKLQDGTAAQPWVLQTEIVKPIVLDAWQTIVFDFENDTTAGAPAPLDRTDFNRVVLQFNGENNNDNVKAYIDDFMYY